MNVKLLTVLSLFAIALLFLPICLFVFMGCGTMGLSTGLDEDNILTAEFPYKIRIYAGAGWVGDYIVAEYNLAHGSLSFERYYKLHKGIDFTERWTYHHNRLVFMGDRFEIEGRREK